MCREHYLRTCLTFVFSRMCIIIKQFVQRQEHISCVRLPAVISLLPLAPYDMRT